MPLFMLDTNICIYAMKRPSDRLRERFNANAEHLSISSVTLCELHYGAEKSARRSENLQTIENFAARLDVLPFPPSAAADYGEIRAALERTGRPASANDMLIGAHARAEGLTLVTNNMREFERMPGLRVENWV